MTDAKPPESRSGDAGDCDAETGLVRGNASGRRVTLNVESVTLPVGVRVEQLRLRATGTAVLWALLALAVVAAVVGVAWLARTT